MKSLAQMLMAGSGVVLIALVTGCSKEPEPLDWRTTLENSITLPDGSTIRILTSEPDRLDMQLGQLLTGITGRVKVEKQVPGVGTVFIEMDVVNGLREGEELIYAASPFGERHLVCRMTNHNGKRDGEYIGYFPDQKMQCRIQFANDVKHGTEEIFYPNGKCLMKATHKEGKLDGPFTLYNSDGSPFTEGSCEGGHPFSGIFVDDPNMFLQNAVTRTSQKVEIPAARYEAGERKEDLKFDFTTYAMPETATPLPAVPAETPENAGTPGNAKAPESTGQQPAKTAETP